MKFYKIFRTSNSEKSKLKLPEKFERRFGDKLPKIVTLDVPSGAKWRVGVAKSEDGVWFMGQGWDECVEGLSLKNGDFLMLEYDEELRGEFHLVVMDVSASEIDYPALDSNKDQDDHVFLDDADELVTASSHRGLVHRSGYDREKGETIIDKDGQIKCMVKGRKVDKENSTTEGMEHTLARAKAFKATEPHFIVTLQPSYLGIDANHAENRRCQLRVPQPFIMSFFNLEDKNMILETPDSNTWPMLYKLWGDNARFSKGWKYFAEAKSLTTGDVCLFELNRATPNALKVAIFRTTGEDEVPISTTNI